LATRAGLSPAAYCRLTGAICGTRLLVQSSTGSARGRPGWIASGAVATTVPPEAATRLPCRPSRPARRVNRDGNRLAYYRRYAEHTVAVQQVLVGFVCAARAAQANGDDHALEAWQGEWAALRRYPYEGQWHTLRPDAYGCYRAGTTTVAFFLELDRATSGLRDLATKLAAYCAYRDSGLFARNPPRGGPAFPVMLVVTTSDERLRNILAQAQAVAVDRMTRPLALWGATATDLAAHGPLGSVWRDTVQQPACNLWPETGTGVIGRGGGC
jgi:hypothetical protein